MYKASTATMALLMLLKICNDRDNPSHTYTHEDVANLPSDGILDYLDLCTL